MKKLMNVLGDVLNSDGFFVGLYLGTVSEHFIRNDDGAYFVVYGLLGVAMIVMIAMRRMRTGASIAAKKE